MSAEFQSQDRRGQERRPAKGSVHLEFQDPIRHELIGDLIDVSEAGFRAAHSCFDLRLGQVVEFESQDRSGHARVIWNRISAARIESGFFVLPLSNGH